MKVKLLVVGGDAKAAEINLRLPAIIGRGRESTITLPHPLVSRKHCELYEVGGTLMVRDLGSLNGTYVGSQRIVEARLPPGELLTVGTVNFRAVYSPAEDVDDTEWPYADGTEDSTNGVGEEKPRAESGSRADTATVPEPAEKAASPQFPIERDTEWQVGNKTPRHDSKDGDDLSSLLNDSR